MDDEDLFHLALEMPVAERPAFLDRECAGDVSRRRRMEVLLQSHDAPDSFLVGPAVGPGMTADLRAGRSHGEIASQNLLAEGPGSQIGRYKLLQALGEGGMGNVFMAEQTQPVRRKVALKVIKPGLDSRQIIARFEAERQALALMDHISIARVLDAGTTDLGRPYFVMELVHGVPITRYCDDNHLTSRQRLDLFVPVCRAIQHAHQKGIIHRDIKPSNVMITLFDGNPVPKVIDFGVAKAIEQQLTERTLFTQYGTLVGTLEYMSPEQAEMSALGVDTRSDIYSLGALLYELLTGSTPLTHQCMKQAAFGEILRMIKEEEPPRPSTRLSDSRETLTSIAAQRHTEPAKLTKLMRGELDWIVMKAIEKDRNRRYETASDFAADVQRYLDDEPVQACPPSTWYRFRKFTRRNRAALITATIIAAALVAGTAVATWQSLRATSAMATAVIEKQRADKQAAVATNIAESLKQLLRLVDPDADKGPSYTVLELIDDYAVNLEEKLADQPEAAADLHAAIGRAYACRGQRQKALKHLERALELRRSVFGDKHETYADSLVDFARPDARFGQSEVAAGEVNLRQALAIYRARGVGGQPVIRALKTLGWSLGEQASMGAVAKRNEIEPVLKEALAEADKSPDVEFPELAAIYRGLAGVELDRFRYTEAERFARMAVAMHLKLNKDSIETAWSHYTLGETLTAQGKFAAALAAEKHALSMMRRSLPPEHVGITNALAAVNRTLDGADKSHELADLLPSVAALGEWESALREVLVTTKPTKLIYADPRLESIKGLVRFREYYLRLGDKLAAAGKTREAEESQQKAIRLLASLQSQLAADPAQLSYLYTYGTIALMKAAEPGLAKELCRKLLDQLTPSASGHYDYLASFLANADVPAHRDPALAIELAKKAVELNARSNSAWQSLGWAHFRMRDWKASIDALEKSCALQQDPKGGDAWQWFCLAMAHRELGQKEVARKWYDQAAVWMDKNQPEHQELRRFRAEAAALLDVSDKKN